MTWYLCRVFVPGRKKRSHIWSWEYIVLSSDDTCNLLEIVPITSGPKQEMEALKKLLEDK